jgi:hypothetical protein
MQQENRLFTSTIIILLLSFSVGCLGPKVHSKPGTTTTVILIRHADRNDNGHLTAKGHERTKALVDAVSDMDITAIYSPNLERNLDTVTPLANHLGIDITLTPKISMPVVNKIVNEILTKHAGGVVLWVGNISGNLQTVYRRLGGTGKGPLKYGDLYILTIQDKGPAKVIKSRYGL